MAERSQRWPGRTSLTVAGGEHARLTQEGTLRVRVHGVCHGVVSCAGQRRYSWGPFAHVFALSAEAGSVTVVARGVRGTRSVQVELDPRAELREPRVSGRRGEVPRTTRIAPPPHAAIPTVASLGPRVAASAPRTSATVLPSLRRLHSRAPSPVLRAIGVALRLPRPGESR
jgi:hypothetical protein